MFINGEDNNSHDPTLFMSLFCADLEAKWQKLHAVRRSLLTSDEVIVLDEFALYLQCKSGSRKELYPPHLQLLHPIS